MRFGWLVEFTACIKKTRCTYIFIFSLRLYILCNFRLKDNNNNDNDDDNDNQVVWTFLEEKQSLSWRDDTGLIKPRLPFSDLLCSFRFAALGFSFSVLQSH